VTSAQWMGVRCSMGQYSGMLDRYDPERSPMKRVVSGLEFFRSPLWHCILIYASTMLIIICEYAKLSIIHLFYQSRQPRYCTNIIFDSEQSSIFRYFTMVWVFCLCVCVCVCVSAVLTNKILVETIVRYSTLGVFSGWKLCLVGILRKWVEKSGVKNV